MDSPLGSGVGFKIVSLTFMQWGFSWGVLSVGPGGGGLFGSE